MKRMRVSFTSKGSKSIAPKEAQAIVQQEINPHLHKIDQLIKSNTDSLNIRATGMIVFDLALVISAGVFGNWENSFRIGGLYTLKDILGTIFHARTKPQDVLNDDYFFLWSIRAKANG